MSAWVHKNSWNGEFFLAYCQFVADQCPKFKGLKDDCADLSVRVIIEFAANNGLPLNFYTNVKSVFSSRANGEVPKTGIIHHTWSTPEEFLKGVKARINSTSLLNYNTRMYGDIRSGDLMILKLKPPGSQPGVPVVSISGHAALVFRYDPPHSHHPFENWPNIPDFPGPEQAAKELQVLEYFRTPRDWSGVVPYCKPKALADDHCDFLNHRGEGSPKKERAELNFFASVPELRKSHFEFRRYRPITLDLPPIFLPKWAM